jgi:hypothetical protein
LRLLHEPLLTYELSPLDLHCEAGSLYLHSSGPEERSLLDTTWVESQAHVTFVNVLEVDGELVEFDGVPVALRDRAGLESAFDGAPVYIDMTGMTYSAWAPLLAAALNAGLVTRVVYREPVDYKRSENPTRGMIYDLSERIAGIAPLPGLASLRRRAPADSVFVPLLGFEGARLAHVLESSEPISERVVPIVGAPGFRPEYTTQALLSGRLTLEQDGHYSRIQFAKANCPFDLFHELLKIQDHFNRAFLRVAPVGTKPHGLGAVLFAISRPGRAEIVYDHPIRKVQRTTGQSRVCLYEVSQFAESEMFTGTGTYA